MKDNLTQFKGEFASLYAYLYRYVAYRVPEKEDAEDVVSDVFLTALGKIADYEAERGNLRQWLTGIARFKVLTYWRGRKTHVPLDELLLVPAATPVMDVIGRLSHALEAELLLRRASPTVKALLAMRYVDGLTYREIAEALGQEPDAVRQRFSRLYRELRMSSPDEYYAE